MASLEQRLEDKEYKYWVKAGICLLCVKTGLEIFADERSKKTHGFVKAAFIGPNQTDTICNHAKIVPKKGTGIKWKLNCCNDCEKYVDEIAKFQAPPFTFNKYNWQNSNVQLWPTEAWEMMKVFMNPGQKAYQKSPKDTDLSGLVNFIEHCSVPYIDIQNKSNIPKVRDARNKIMHSASMKISEADFISYTTSMIGLLEDPLFLCHIQEAQIASSTIKEIKASTFQISKAAEFEVLREKTAELKKLNEHLRDEVDELKVTYSEMQTSVDKDTKEIRSLLKEETTQRDTEISKITNEIEMKERQLKELSTELILIKKLIHQDRDLFKKMDIRVGSVELTLQETSNELQEVKQNLTSLIAQVQDLFKKVDSHRSGQNQDIPLKKDTSLRKQNNELEKQLEDLTKQLNEATIHNRTVAVDKEIGNLREEKRKLECEIRDLKKSLDGGDDRHKQFQDIIRVKDLMSENDRLLLENKQLQELLNRANSENCVSEIKHALKQSQERNEALEYELECTKSKGVKRLEKELVDYEQRNSCLELDLERAHTHVKDLTILVEEVELVNITQKERSTHLESFVKDLQETIKTLKSGQESSDVCVQSDFALKYHNEILRRAKMELESSLERTTSMNGVLQSHINQLTEKTEKQQMQIEFLLKKQDLLSSELKQSKSQTDRLNEKLADFHLKQAESLLDKSDKFKHSESQTDDFHLDLKLEKQRTKENTTEEKIIPGNKVTEAGCDNTPDEKGSHATCSSAYTEDIYEDLDSINQQLHVDPSSCKINKVVSDVTSTPITNINPSEEEIYELDTSPNGANTHERVKQTRNETDDEPGLILQALYDFEARGETELSFQKDNFFVLQNEGDDIWWYVRDLKDKKVGYVPKSYVVPAFIPYFKPWDLETLMKTTCPAPLYDDISERHVVANSRKRIPIASLDETRIARITGLEFLDDGRLVICDHDNCIIKLFNDCLTKSETLILDKRPRDAAMVNSSTIVVTVPHAMQLYYLHVKKTLKVKYIVHVGRMCWGIAVMGDEIYITCHNNPGQGEVRVLHLNGSLKRIIRVNDRDFWFKRPNYLCVSAVTGFIFVSDFDLRTVTCLTSDGRISKQCFEKKPTGVCLDSRDNIVSCGCQIFKQVMVLSAYHDEVKIMIGDDVILDNLLSIAYRKKDRILVVGCHGNDLLVFKLTF